MIMASVEGPRQRGQTGATGKVGARGFEGGVIDVTSVCGPDVSNGTPLGFSDLPVFDLSSQVTHAQ